MNKRIICLFCSALIITGIFTACKKVDTDQDLAALLDSAAQLISTTQQNTPVSTAGAYWKTAGFDGIELETGDYWSDLFLWEDGTGYFRFSQATPMSNYYGMHDVMSCDWSLEENGSLTLFSPGTSTVLYAGSVADNVLTIRYDGYAEETIEMEQAEMPPYGSHWTILGLYGTWKMISYTDAASGYHEVGYYTVGGKAGYFASEITLDQVSGVHFWLADPLSHRFEMARDMQLGSRDDDTWHPYTAGPAWEGCANEAWHVALTGNDDPDARFFVTFADGKLLLKKEDLNNPNSFPSSYTAEFEYVGYRDDLGEGDGEDTVNRRYAEVAYSVILDQYRNAMQLGWDLEKTVDMITLNLKEDANIDDETMLSELYNSVEEPLRGNSNLGYAIRDINEDGAPELFILSEDGYSNDYTINSFYTLHNGRTVLAGAYWSRKRCAIAEDGTVYIDGSSSADDSFFASYSLDPTTGELQLIETSDIPGNPDVTAEAAGLFFTPLINSPAAGASNAGASQLDPSANHIFSDIVGYGGKVYSLYASPEIPNFKGIKGSAKFTPLPEAIGKSMESQGMYINEFTIYQDKIYYLAAEAGSDITLRTMYQCDLDGGRNEMLAGPDIFFTCMISDGWLYYDTMTDESDYEVYAINLNNMSRERLDEFPVYIEPGICDYNGFYYYFSGNTLHKKEIQTEATSEIATLAAGPMNAGGDGVVITVVNETVYYATLGEYSDNGNVHLFGVSIFGGASEHLASWFMA